MERTLEPLTREGKHWDGGKYTALEIARTEMNLEVVSLLEKFIDNPSQTRCELRVKLGVFDALAAEYFAIVVFFCDDLLQIKPFLTTTTTAEPDTTAAVRFFGVISKLPMELQMILYHRAAGSLKQNILRKDSEIAFKSLASTLLLLSSQVVSCLFLLFAIVF